MRMKTRKARVVQNQPILTKKTLKRFFLRAKYDGASEGGCDCRIAEYGALRACGSRSEKREPRRRVLG